MPAAARCGQQADAFSAVLLGLGGQTQGAANCAAAGGGLEAACRAAAAQVLAGAPAAVMVSELRCHPGYAGEYAPQQLPINGRPHWAQAAGAGGRHLYWAPVFGPTEFLSGSSTPTPTQGALTSP